MGPNHLSVWVIFSPYPSEKVFMHSGLCLRPASALASPPGTVYDVSLSQERVGGHRENLRWS